MTSKQSQPTPQPTAQQPPLKPVSTTTMQVSKAGGRTIVQIGSHRVGID